MVEIRPFKALHYSDALIGRDLSKVITQPYDKINREMLDEYYKKHEYNFAKLILPREENRYEMAAKRLQEWKENGIIVRDKEPGIYIYTQEFELRGKKYTRRGFIAAMRLHPFEERVVLPHEKTHRGPKEDRLNMLRATKTNLEAGFVLYKDDGRVKEIIDEVIKGTPDFYGVDDYGTITRLYKVNDYEKIRTIQDVLKDEQVVIADGHHRYETAVYFRDEMRSKIPDWKDNSAFNYRMTYMVSLDDPGLIVLPTHRLLAKVKIQEEQWEKIKEYFSVEEIDIKETEEFLKENKNSNAFVVYQDGKAYGLVRNKDVSQFMNKEWSEAYRSLDAVVLREVIFKILGVKDPKIDEDIYYERWIEDAVEKVDKKVAKVAFLLNPTPPEIVLEVARHLERMPQKTTDFYPKVISGFTMMPVNENEFL
ncbi:DUF1015 domain-containing protein [Candidatus Aciduliprofundum boonei]|uniref:DUF1015 domain-containing protein n=1 Tax=Aciduliprofundum boonei (strain DSM 19572 / T469) TaxID=439481 RepID=B5ID08_ACIB4|nr:DUF1015 domain-containing protein [Candidatus Aciduliprofundum boonei]ADD09229.1 conserved hypothetical protein [Aciduliprofundum boonei T469]EDY35828.1 conserved hypothetical protein [Aciduliprofundum boonei T469]HII55807.1 DUF1015 domain-containing protein [Candidatus Aciduliprofundum boonei]